MPAQKRFTLTRTKTSDQGTFGTFCGEGMSLQSAELPWRGNSQRYSCIPPGSYICRPYSSGRFSNVYEVTGVPGRTAILIHSGNFAGDTDKGFKSDVEGCILLGLTYGSIDGQQAVKSSRAALDALRDMVEKEPFELVIVDDTGAA